MENPGHFSVEINRLAKIRPFEPPPPEPEDSDASGTRGQESGHELRSDDAPPSPPGAASEGAASPPKEETQSTTTDDETVLTIINAVLREELDEAEATRLTSLIGARLAAAGF